MAAFDERVFKANDIRGTYPGQLSEGFAYRLGTSAVKGLGARRVAIGRDCRLSSPALYAALARGIRDAGGSVGALGLCPIELLYYVAGTRPEFDLLVMVTASHNPPEHNGFKVLGRGATPLDDAAGLGALCRYVGESNVPVPDSFDAPATDLKAEEEYMRFALDVAGAPDVSRLKVVADPGNGTGGILWQLLAKALAFQPVAMNFEPDGRFPAHHPNPAKPANIEPLRRRVFDEKADLGFAHDGDAYRTVAMLADGHLLDGGEMIVALIERLFGGRASAPCAVSMVASRKALDFLRARGTDPLIVPVGHMKVRRIMQARPELTFGGEQSGHYFYRQFFCCESSLITTLHLMHLAAAGRLQGLTRGLPGPWISPAEEPEFHFARQADAVATCRAAACAAVERFPRPLEIMCEEGGRVRRRSSPADAAKADGIRVDYKDWWFAMRPSGTEPLARLTVEARSEDEARSKQQALSEVFEAHRVG